MQPAGTAVPAVHAVRIQAVQCVVHSRKDGARSGSAIGWLAIQQQMASTWQAMRGRGGFCGAAVCVHGASSLGDVLVPRGGLQQGAAIQVSVNWRIEGGGRMPKALDSNHLQSESSCQPQSYQHRATVNIVPVPGFGQGLQAVLGC